MMLILTIVLFAGAGAGLGALFGAPGLTGVGGGFVGIVAGFALVYTRFKNI